MHVHKEPVAWQVKTWLVAVGNVVGGKPKGISIWACRLLVHRVDPCTLRVHNCRWKRLRRIRQMRSVSCITLRNVVAASCHALIRRP